MSDLQDEFKRLADLIEAPDNLRRQFQPKRSQGAATDTETVLEEAFKAITAHMAVFADLQYLSENPDARLGVQGSRYALTQYIDHEQERIQRYQEDLLGQLNPVWRTRLTEHAKFSRDIRRKVGLDTWRGQLPAVRGKLLFDEPLAPFTWFRVGGIADVIFLPADLDDLSDFLKAVDPAVPVTAIGVGSNLLVRDGGVDGVVIRLGKAFADVEARDNSRIYTGAAALDAQVAKVAAQAGIAGLEFYRGVPGTIGGAIVMNAGCYGAETKDVLVEAYAVTRSGERVTLSNAEMGYSYRHSEAEGLIYTGALYQGTPDDAAVVTERMEAITARREQTQPIREKTGGSTFKNPEGRSAWQCVDEAGWRGKLYGGAKFSDLHANFMINTGEATAADLEGLGEAVRADVRDKLGVELNWEIKRIGRAV